MKIAARRAGGKGASCRARRYAHIMRRGASAVSSPSGRLTLRLVPAGAAVRVAQSDDRAAFPASARTISFSSQTPAAVVLGEQHRVAAALAQLNQSQQRRRHSEAIAAPPPNAAASLADS